ncbi:putative MarR family transcription regulator [Humitalea rosea]|uniref:Putative MarR family transcription regulator n=1 Tax=Humitalea rosea TaxID=990373 RepID=A0A2W7ILI0_9PROT|nr:winged helix DNA-binding protein [Humitalea rosea]PZW46877.1 putative MarR family transcription regulator [Humitalea rosea]
MAGSPVSIVSSAHLAAGSAPALSEAEYGLLLAGHAFNRWIIRCMAAAGQPGLSATDVLVLHTVHHRDRPKRLAEIGLVLGIEDQHLVVYAVRKLAGLGLVETARVGKESLVTATAAGQALCARYAEVREALLAETVAAGGPAAQSLSEAAAILRALAGAYDQAARAAVTL